MEIVNIFAIVKNSLLAVQFDGKESDEFSMLFKNWQDVEYLEQFFEDNKQDLQSGFYGNITIEDAVFQTIEEAESMERYIKKVVNRGNSDPNNTLHDLVFTPLHKNDITINHQESKAYGQNNHSWLRMYAIRISTNLYVVSGGAIKLTKKIQDSTHTTDELLKLKITAAYLKEIGLIVKEDYGFIEISSHGK
jgi:hypothetical protein